MFVGFLHNRWHNKRNRGEVITQSVTGEVPISPIIVVCKSVCVSFFFK